MKNFFICIALISLVLLTAMGPKSPAPDKNQSTSPFEVEGLINAKAPDFTLRDMQGKAITLSSLRGKVVVLNFWATWCPPCKAEMPSLNRLYRDLKARGLEIIAVSSDSASSYVKDYLAKTPLDFTIVHDETKAVTKQYKVFSMPTTFLIDRNGIVVEKFFGEYDWAEPETRQKIEKFL